MNEKEFVTWMKGFVTACNNYQPTPAQWDELVDTLKTVESNQIKTNVFDSEKKNVFDIATIKIPKNYWNTNDNKQQKQLLND